MHPALMTPSGIPRSGLVCWHDLYDPTESLASVPDLSGNGYSLQRGSIAGADTNDPAWATGGKGLVFTTDDYCLSPNLPVAMTGPWTIVLAARHGNELANSHAWSIADASVDGSPFVSMRCGTTGFLQPRSYNGVSATSPGTLLTVPTASICVVAMTVTSAGLVASRIDTGVSVSCAHPSPAPSGNVRVGLGCWAAKTPINIAGSLSAYSHLFYSRALSNAEIQRIYRSLKATWAARGVTIL